MAERALRFCAHPGCKELVSIGYCAKHNVERQEECKKNRKYYTREYDKDRLNSCQRGYNSRWQKARLTYLRHHPLCAECERNSRLTPATVVDHIIPHKGDKTLFWDKANWQGLCKPCHDRKTARESRQGEGGPYLWGKRP